MKQIVRRLSMVLVLVMILSACSQADVSTNAENQSSDSDNEITEEVKSTESNQAEADTPSTDIQPTTNTYAYDGALTLSGLEESVSVAYNDLYAMASVTAHVHHLSSTGEETDDQVTGVLLDTVLADYGLSQRDFTAIRLVAGDGYQITVPADLIQDHDIVLAYDFNGEGLDEKQMPLRAAIDGVRSMYYVSNLVEIAFSDQAVAPEAGTTSDLILLETAINGLESETYIYYDSSDLAVKVEDLLKATANTSEEDLRFLAADGLEKTESMAVFRAGYIKFTGPDAPMFIDPDIQKGMYIKAIMKAQSEGITYVSVASAIEAYGEKTIGDKTGLAMTDFFTMAGMDGQGYTLTATDGYEVEIEANSLKDGLFYLHEETGNVAMTFTEAYDKSYSMKDILSIQASQGGGDNTASQSDDTIDWTITVEGLADGAFDMTGERAARKLDLVALHTERSKNDDIYPEDWTGYRVLDILSFLHVESFSSLVMVASDGYEVEIGAGDIDDETIVAVTKDGQPLDPEFKIQLVQNTEFATTWVKGLAKIIVKADGEAGTEVSSQGLALEPWTITFEGLADGSFDLSSEKAAQKMTLVALHTDREKNDVVYPEDWTGYSLEEILGWLKVTSFSAITVVAADGYEVDLLADQIDSETIIAITKDGEPIDSAFVVQLVQNTQFATTWVKGVAKIVVRP